MTAQSRDGLRNGTHASTLEFYVDIQLVNCYRVLSWIATALRGMNVH